MKNHCAITISDNTGSRHFFAKASTKRNLILTSITILVVVVTSFIANGFQYGTNFIISNQKEKLNEELVRSDSLNSNLNQIIANHKLQIKNISKGLVDIERSSGVDTSALDINLEERIRLIGQFYNVKEDEYSEIGSRVQHIEGVIGMENSLQEFDEDDLATRVELANLTASRERILHDSIPNGYPTNLKKITSEFGMRIHPVTKVNSFHKGVDIRAKMGNEIYATADGFVSISDYLDLSGNRIVLMHNFGFESRYSHLKNATVAPGDVVHKGDLIGYSGNTGRSIAPHLHYEVRYLGKSIDPIQFLNWEFGTHEIFSQVRGIKWPSLISLINKQITHQTLQLSQLDHTSQVE